MLDQLRRDRRYRAILEIWLVAHTPLSFALLAVLIAHVVSVFYYWERQAGRPTVILVTFVSVTQGSQPHHGPRETIVTSLSAGA